MTNHTRATCHHEWAAGKNVISCEHCGALHPATRAARAKGAVAYEVIFPRYGGRQATSEFLCLHCYSLVEDTPEHPEYEAYPLRVAELEPIDGRGMQCDRCDNPFDP